MGILIDLVIIGIVILSTYLAYHKGLVKLAIGLCSFAIAIVVTVLLYIPISNLIINTTGIDEAFENAIYEKANEVMQSNNEQDDLTSQVVETTKNEMLPETARALAINIVRGGVILVLLIGIRIALRFITVLADFIARLPIIHQVNKAGGIIYGIVRGILLVYVLLLLATVSGKINSNNSINQGIEESVLGKTMYQNNVLNVFFK